MKQARLYFLICILGMCFVFGCKKEEDEPVLPTVETQSVDVLSDQTAAAFGRVVSSGSDLVSERGFVWNVSGTPTINGNIITAGTGDGEFESLLTDLEGGTTYYVRAFATNLAGTAYGDEISFTTVQLQGFDYFGSTIYVHPTDNTINNIWGGSGILVGASSDGYGYGNTITISSQSGIYAAKDCNSLNAFGYSDWYLPAKDELEALYAVQDQWGNFDNSLNLYWSSTEVDAEHAYAVNFATGETISRLKYSQCGCRCVRKE